MVEISSFIHQFYISEAEEKGNNGKPIFKANCYTNGGYSCENKNEVSPFPQWLYPTESIVRKKEFWLEIQNGGLFKKEFRLRRNFQACNSSKGLFQSIK